jgi:hypothetical protein
MAILAGSLASGQLATSKATIYTSGNISYIKAVTFHNVGVSTETIAVYVNRLVDGTSRRVRQFVLDPQQSYRLFGKDDAYSLSAGDLLEAQTTNALSVDYTVTGGVE